MGAPISKAFLIALAESFEEFGGDSVRQVRDNDPEAYASVFASVIPKDAAPSDIYSDAQMDGLCDALSEMLAKAVRNGVQTIH